MQIILLRDLPTSHPKRWASRVGIMFFLCWRLFLVCIFGSVRLEKSKKLLIEGCRSVGEKTKRLPKQILEAKKRREDLQNLKVALGDVCRKLQQRNKVR